MKKLQSLILAILWSTSFAFSASSGTCGDDLTWTLDDDGVLTISGTGAMTSYSYGSAPWYGYYGYYFIYSLVIEDGVTSIGDYAFLGCYVLTNVTIGSSVTSIGDYAFYNCSSLTSITIPDGVTSIGSYAFYSCTSLTSITVSEGNTAYASVDGVLYTYDMTELICYPAQKTDTSFTITDGVTSIGSSAFYGCSSLTSITIPESVTSIGSSAFYGCSSLTSVTIGSGVTSIGNKAFYNCTKLTSITSLNTTPPVCYSASTSAVAIFSSSTYTSATLTAASNLYAYTNIWKKFSTIEFTEDAQTDLTTISGQCGDNLTWTLDLTSLSLVFEGSGEMYDYSSSTLPDYLPYAITTVSLPDGLTSIGNYAFYCSSITSIEIPDGVTSIGGSAFYYSSLTSIELPEGLTSINRGVFFGCSSLESVVIPSGVTSIASGAFDGCTSLTSVTSLATTPPICDSDASFNMTAYDNATLYAASNLYQLALYWKNFSTIEYTEDAQTDLTTISGQCGDNLTWTLNLADSTLTITGSGDMYDYDYVGSPWYHYKEYVTTATLSDELTTVGDYAFMGCSSLTSIEIPESVTSIGNLAFYQCTALTSVTSLASTPPTCGSGVFSSSTYTSATLYAASSDYLTADYWEDFENCVISGNAISDIAAEVSTIRTVGNTIVITSPARATAKVVSLSGTVIKEVIVYQGETQIQMAHGGVYIVLLSDGTKAKVLIK